eukprot:5037116-Karenia_brevis.AAC.1
MHSTPISYSPPGYGWINDEDNDEYDGAPGHHPQGKNQHLHQDDHHEQGSPYGLGAATEPKALDDSHGTP